MVEEYLRLNTSPSEPAPESRAGKIKTDIEEGIEKLEEKISKEKDD